MSTRRVGPMGVRRDMRPMGAIAGGSAAAWSPLALSPEVFAIIDDAYITQSGTISAVVNQGTDGGSFTQATAGDRPEYVANHFGAGNHAAQFAGVAWMSMAHAINSSKVTIVAGVDCTDNTPAIGCVLGWGAVPPEVAVGTVGATGNWYSYHYGDVFYSACDSGDTANTTARCVIGEADTTKATLENTIWVDASTAGNTQGHENDNTSAFNASSSWMLGIRATATGFNFVGRVRFVMVFLRVLTADERADIQAWAAGQLA